MSERRKKAIGGGKRSTLKEASSPVVMTIGHSTRALDEFIGLLQAHGVTRVVDVRTISRSWHNPQFNQDSLPDSLKKAGLSYVHLPGLGGLRHAKPDSINVGWRNASFRGYADYMQTPEFEQSLGELVQMARQERVAIMCAEAVPWRCHRSLIADALLVRGIRAGDSFNGGYLCASLGDLSLKERLVVANAVTAFFVTHGTPPTKEELIAQIEKASDE